MQRTVTKRVLSIAGAAVVGGLLSLAAVTPTKSITSKTIIGSSPNTWEEAAQNGVAGANCSSCTFGEVEKLDLRLENGKVVEYRVWLRVE